MRVLPPSGASCSNLGESSGDGGVGYSALPNPSHGSSRSVLALANHNAPVDNIETNLGKSMYRQITVSSCVTVSAGGASNSIPYLDPMRSSSLNSQRHRIT